MREGKSRSRTKKKQGSRTRRWKWLLWLGPLFRNWDRLWTGLYGILYLIKYTVWNRQGPAEKTGKAFRR